MKNYLYLSLLPLVLFSCTKESYVNETIFVEDSNSVIYESNLETLNPMEGNKVVELTFYGNFGLGSIVNTSSYSDTIITYNSYPENIIVDTTVTYTIGVGDYISVLAGGYSCFIELDVTIDGGETYTVFDDDNNSLVNYFLQNYVVLAHTFMVKSPLKSAAISLPIPQYNSPLTIVDGSAVSGS